MGDIFSLGRELRDEREKKTRVRRCFTCADERVLEQIDIYFEGVDNGQDPLSMEDLYYALKSMFPEWRAHGTTTLRNHFRLNHDTRWQEA